MSLLDACKETKRERVNLFDIEITDEFIEVAIAWAKDEVSTAQIGKALNLPRTNYILPVQRALLKVFKQYIQTHEAN